MDNEFPYEIIEEYVRGGCSVIYKIKPRNELLEDADRKFVLKTMSVQDDDPQSVQRFYMEYEFLRAYGHPNLVEVKDYFPDWHGRPAYVMEWVEGYTWQDYWADRPPLEDPRLFLHIFGQLCRVIDYIHKHQIIHRDLKPQNVLISNDDVLKLIDFGIMKVADLTLYTHRNTFMGSAYYVAPEGISGEPVGNTADIFSLGVMLYDLFTGMKPFQGHTLGETIYQRLAKKPQPPSQIADVPKALDGIILKMMERDPHQRQPNCAAVFEQLEAVFGRFEPTATVEGPEIDILTKSLLLHGPFLSTCERQLRERHTLYICGPESSGKTTIVENLTARMKAPSVLRLDCRSGSNEMEIIEIILRHLSVPTSVNRSLGKWKEILAAALPGLLWPAPDNEQSLNPSTIRSAFKQVMLAVNKQAILVVEDLQEASPSLISFMQFLAQLAASRENPNLFAVVTAVRPIANFTAAGKPLTVSFPDTLSLSEYLSGHFGGCRIPVELTENLVEMSGRNLGKLVRMIGPLEASGRLSIESGVLTLSPATSANTVPVSTGRETSVPAELEGFGEDELNHLAWLALCPDGIDMNILKSVTRTDIATLGTTIDKAGAADLLEFQSSVTEGFRWKNAEVKRYLVNALSNEEKLERFLELARTIERESKPFLPYSPPLWLILCRLYQQAGNDDEAADYAFRYAKHCAQTANYEPVRNLLSQFIPLPRFQDNQELWCMLALANRETDVGQALYYAKKALKIGENIEVLALLAILEFAGENPARTKVCVHKVFAKGGIENLDIQYAAQLMPILMQLGETENAGKLYQSLVNKLKGRDDLFATNTLVLAEMQYVQTDPQKVLDTVAGLHQELLPQTRHAVDLIRCRAHQQLFQYDEAIAVLEGLETEEGDPEHYREWLYLYLMFGRMTEVKHLCSTWQRRAEHLPSLARLKPLFDLVTEILVGDPKVYDLDYLISSIEEAELDRSSWLALLVSLLDFWIAEADLIDGVIAIIETAAVADARHHLERLFLISKLKRNRFDHIAEELSAAAEHARQHHLLTERLRLFALARLISAQGWAEPRPDFDFPDGFLDRPAVRQFIAQQYRPERPEGT